MNSFHLNLRCGYHMELFKHHKLPLLLLPLTLFLITSSLKRGNLFDDVFLENDEYQLHQVVADIHNILFYRRFHHTFCFNQLFKFFSDLFHLTPLRLLICQRDKRWIIFILSPFLVGALNISNPWIFGTINWFTSLFLVLDPPCFLLLGI